MAPSRETRRTATLAVVGSGNFAQLGARFLLGAVVPLVLVTFDATKADLGAALTGMWAVYALLQFPSGVLADRYGERSIILLGLAGTTAGTALVALAPSVGLFGVAALVLGAGTGLFFSPASSLVSRLYDDHGGALGALTASGAVAGILYPAAGGVVGVRFGWRAAVVAGGLAAVPVLLATHRLVAPMAPANPGRSLRAAFDPGRYRDVLARPSVAYTTVVAVTLGFAFQSITSFFPTFLVEHRGVDTALAGVVFGGVFGLSAVAQPVAGRVSDRYSRDAAIGASAVLAASGVVILLGVPGRGGLVAGAVTLGVGVSWPGTIQARIVDQLGESERGYGFGLVRSVYMLFASVGSVVTGTLAAAGGWVLGYGAVAALLVGCLCLLGANRALGREL